MFSSECFGSFTLALFPSLKPCSQKGALVHLIYFLKGHKNNYLRSEQPFKMGNVDYYKFDL